MDELERKAQIFLDVVIAARGEGAAGWTMEDLDRAYGWAKYFEQAYGRIRTKSDIAERFDRRLKVLASTEAAPLGHQQFSLRLLGDAESFLDQALLQNSRLPPELYSVVLHKSGQASARQTLSTKDVVAISQLQPAVQLVGHMRELLHRTHNDLVHSEGPAISGCCQERNVDIEASALLLFQYLKLHLAETTSTQRTKEAVTRKLQEIVRLQQGWEAVLTSMILNVDKVETKSGGPSVDGQSHPVCRFLLQWVLQQTKNSRRMFQVRSSLLVQVATVYFSFYKAYLTHLVGWGKDMVVTGHIHHSRSWRHRTGADQFSFKELLSHVLSLLKGPLHVASATLKSIQSLPVPAASPADLTVWEVILRTPQIIAITQRRDLL